MSSPKRFSLFRSRENSVSRLCKDVESSIKEFDRHLTMQKAITNRIEFWASTLDNEEISKDAEKLAKTLREYWVEEEKLKAALKQFSDTFRTLGCEEDALIRSKAKLDAAEKQVEAVKLKARNKDPSKVIHDHDMIAKSSILHSQVRAATKTTFIRFNAAAQRVLRRAFTELFAQFREVGIAQQDAVVRGWTIGNGIQCHDDEDPRDTIRSMNIGRSKSVQDFKSESISDHRARRRPVPASTGSIVHRRGSAGVMEPSAFSAPIAKTPLGRYDDGYHIRGGMLGGMGSASYNSHHARSTVPASVMSTPQSSRTPLSNQTSPFLYAPAMHAVERNLSDEAMQWNEVAEGWQDERDRDDSRLGDGTPLV
ncbi:hypothetical protein CJU90_2097 [Yarrowia sp. C11]|nr:hypothetical protein CJU90_2097 [Yarrowia sp. C11]